MIDLIGEPRLAKELQVSEHQAPHATLFDSAAFPDMASGYNFGLDTLTDFGGLDDTWYHSSIF